MVQKVQIDRALLIGSIVCYFIMSVSFMLMPIEALRILPGILFWGGLVVGITFQIILRVVNKALFAKHNETDEKMQKCRMGLLNFGSSPIAMAVDCAMIISFVVMILAFLLTKGFGYICYVFITTTLMTFCLHCILNGRIFFHIKRMTQAPAGAGRKKGKYSRLKEREKNENS